MKRLACLLLTLACASAGAATPLETKHKRQAVTFDYLMESCSVVGETAYGMVPHFDCETFIYGVMDTLAAQRLACFARTLAPWEIYRQLGELPPGRGQQPAAAVVLSMLLKKYPCK